MSQAMQGMWEVLTVEQQAERAEQYGVETLYFCPDSWALRHQWVHQGTGEVQRARCNRWECLYCGPRKVDLWRQLVREAEPTLFLTLTKAGRTVEQARRALTTFMQALRRGSKGRGPHKKGAREAYPVEYFAVLERHQDFERNGFHWHLLLKGVESIPYKEVIQPLWMSATHYDEETGEGAKIAHIERIRNTRAIGYVTKYLTKSLTDSEKGQKQVQRERVVLVENAHGKLVAEKQMEAVEVVSKAHRVCYSRSFFPECVAELHKRLFAGLENETMEQQEEMCEALVEEETEKRPGWRLVEKVTKISDEEVATYRQHRVKEVLVAWHEEGKEGKPEEWREEIGLLVAEEVRVLKGLAYREQKRRRLREAFEDMNEGRCHLSRRVIGIWQYQRQQLRLAG